MGYWMNFEFYSEWGTFWGKKQYQLPYIFQACIGHYLKSRLKVGRGKNRESIVVIQARVAGGFD